MERTRNLAIALMMLPCVVGCDGTSRTLAPMQPSPPSNGPVPPSGIHGEITITAISPAPGATVPVRACAPGSTRFCADQPQLTLNVVVEQDIPSALVTVGFDRCATATTPSTSFTAGVRTELRASLLQLSDDGPNHDDVGAALYCQLPATTQQTIVRLWRTGHPATPLLTREFSNSYTFFSP